MWKLSGALLFLTVHLALANLAAESTVTSAKLINAPPPPPPTSLGSLYRSARDDYSSRRHCANCGPGYERDMRSYGRQTGVTGYYSGMGAIEDDRNWYYRPESFDDRYRGGAMQSAYPGAYRQPAYMGYEYDRYMSRPDDRGYGYGYPGMAMRTGYYDGGASRMPYYPEMMRGYGYRGNGYDNLDPHYDYYMTQRGGSIGMNNRDRYSQGYYDDRMSYGGQYDHKNFRPWDQTYSRPLTSSSSSLPPSSPSSSLSAHASYHVQSHPAPEPSYGAHSSGHESSGHYRPGGLQYHQQQSQQHGSDRPDYRPSEPTSDCCRNRYPETASSSQAHASQGGSSYASHSTSGPSALSYGGGDSGHRPSGASGSWNYVSSGTTAGHSGGPNHGVNSGHVGVSINTHGSYGESHSAPQGQYAAGGSSSSHEYGANRGNDHRRESDHRQQSVAYGGRPRPSSLGDTSYLMDRDDKPNSNRVPLDQDPERQASEKSDTRTTSDSEPFTSDQPLEKLGSDESNAQSQTPKKQPNA